MRDKTPDQKQALSLIVSAKKDLEFTLTLKASEESANTIIRNIYECFRMLGEALLVIKGIYAADHVMMINEIINLEIDTLRPLNLLENLRRLRHNINYYAYRANKEEAENIVNLANKNFKKVFEKVKEILEKN